MSLNKYSLFKNKNVNVYGPFQVDDEAMDLNKELITKLLDLDDVDAVYTDQKWPEPLVVVIISEITAFGVEDGIYTPVCAWFFL